jgi:hypothetical protein
MPSAMSTIMCKRHKIYDAIKLSLIKHKPELIPKTRNKKVARLGVNPIRNKR